MKKLNSKSLMVLTILVASTLAMPAMVAGYEDDDTINLSQFDNPSDLIGGFTSGMSSAFGGLGYAGQVMGTVLQMLFLDVVFDNISSYEMLDGVYVYNAYNESTETHDNVPITSTDYYYLPYNYSNLVPEDQGIAYCQVERSGTVDISITTGAGVTFIIWDHDKTFINALNRILTFIRTVNDKMNDSPTQAEMEELIRDGISLITWFLIHLNDIFTGDELFVLNPISWQNIEINPVGSIDIQKSWYMTGTDYQIGGTGDSPLDQTHIDAINAKANNSNDKYIEWLTEGDISISDTLSWSQFTFDLFQLWMKNFNINIDLGGLDFNNPASMNLADLFKGLDVEFYFFTHSLVGTFLYNDTNNDDTLSVKYEELVNPNTNQTITDAEGNPVEIPRDNELTHRLYMQSADKFTYLEPAVTGSNKISWGLNVSDVKMHTIPIGINLNSYQNKSVAENLDYIYLGVSFSPDLSEVITADDGTTYQVASAPVKLDQHFGVWNDEAGPNSPIDGLDLSVIYVSTVLHFHLTATLTQTNSYLENTESYHRSRKVSVGNYLSSDIQNKLEFVDIAGPGYWIGDRAELASRTNADLKEPTTNIIPIGLWQAEEESHNNFKTGAGEDANIYAGDLRIRANFSVMAYAVCYPEFNGTGDGIIHDPTFNVFMIFEPTAFWALILLIGGISILGIATILIKRKKDGKAPF